MPAACQHHWGLRGNLWEVEPRYEPPQIPQSGQVRASRVCLAFYSVPPHSRRPGITQLEYGVGPPWVASVTAEMGARVGSVIEAIWV